MDKIVYNCEYASQILKVYEDRIEIGYKENFLSMILGVNRGIKILYYKDITATEFKPNKFDMGFIEITIPGNIQHCRFMFGDLAISAQKKEEFNSYYKKVYDYIQNKVIECHQQDAKPMNFDDSVSELKKYKELLDLNIITQEEFDKKKKDLLSL